jgi:hypothetical protein
MDAVGWGPRGDSGPVRGRVRATQPAIFPGGGYRASEVRSSDGHRIDGPASHKCVARRVQDFGQLPPRSTMPVRADTCPDVMAAEPSCVPYKYFT